MRGGSQSHLMRCSDGHHYVVKFPNNQQGRRVLANELLGASLADFLSLPVAQGAVVWVEDALVEISEELIIGTKLNSTRCEPGRCFGSRFAVDPRIKAAFDIFPGSLLKQVENLQDFFGMFVFDVWTSNLDSRQVVFVKEKPNAYRAVMIDQGLCFGGATWQMGDCPLKCAYLDKRVYKDVQGVVDFEPWLTILEEAINRDVLDAVAGAIPPEWYGSDRASLDLLLEGLLRRKDAVRNKIEIFASTFAEMFPSWKSRAFGACGGQ
ncbi:MAG: HipA family kinase [Candidatus Acidiferrum sp.]